jgi:hypothetical protein
MAENTNVHITRIAPARCLLPACRNPLPPPRKGGKPQKFCSPECRKIYFKQARKVGQAALSALKELEGDTP